jgi:hypothetical protein
VKPETFSFRCIIILPDCVYEMMLPGGHGPPATFSLAKAVGGQRDELIYKRVDYERFELRTKDDTSYWIYVPTS